MQSARMGFALVCATFLWSTFCFIVHLTSRDLTRWNCGDRLDLGSDRVIDPAIFKKDSVYRLWFKDERKGSRVFVAEGRDLKNWIRQRSPVADIACEGPKVFSLGGYYWLIADAWKGLLVLHLTDLG